MRIHCKKGHTPLYKDFVGAIRDNMEPYINGEGGKKALEIIIRAYDNA